MQALRTTAFFAAIAFCLTAWCSPPLALAAGLVLALTIGNPYAGRTGKATRLLLQVSVVGLGFGMNLQNVVEAGRSGILFTIVSIAATLAFGHLIGRALGIGRGTAHLISSGTAICGGSAIAAVAPVIGASDEEISVSLGTVFVLNAVALFVFPMLGTFLGLTQTEFGVWSGIAIHDTSSVVGAAASYGAEALQVATTVKLARALWIVPLTIATALAFRKRTGRVAVPWFIGLFLVASAVRTWTSVEPAAWDPAVRAAKIGLTVTLFLIGSALSRRSLAAVGARPMILGVALWVLISAASLWAVVAAL